jgi:hypothetical protein
MAAIAHSGRLESTYTGHSVSRWCTSRLAGTRSFALRTRTARSEAAKRKTAKRNIASKKPYRDINVVALAVSAPRYDGPHDAAGRTMPVKAEVSRAALDRGHDPVGDMLVDVKALFLQ